jgi:hypothetical protein
MTKTNSEIDSLIIDVPKINQAPTVNAGVDITTSVDKLGTSLVSVTALGQDLDKDLLVYHWTLANKPMQSQLTNFKDDALGNLAFTPDVLGTYEFNITVSDGHLTATDTINVNIIRGINDNTAPVAKANDQFTTIGKVVTLDGSTSFDTDNDPLTYQWAIKSKPSSSNASLSSVTAMKPTFIADQLGDYILELMVSDGYTISTSSVVKVTAQNTINTLAYEVTDAEYSKALDKVIMVSGLPNQLHIYDAIANTEQTIPLPLPPSSVSVSPDGLYAAVGYNANISYIDLKNKQLIKNLSVGTDVLDIVLASNGYIYAFPKRDQWTSIFSINIATGKTTTSQGSIYAGTIAKLHPNGLSMYGANNGLSPSDIEKYDIQTGTANISYDSPYHGDYAMCGNLWFSEEGSRIFTACSNVFKASDSKDQDMIYNGSLAGLSYIQNVVHSSLVKKVVAIPATYTNYLGITESSDTELYVYDDEFLTPSNVLKLPYFIVNNQGYAGHGRYVFFNKSADTLITILKADSKAELSHDNGVYTIHYDSPVTNK